MRLFVAICMVCALAAGALYQLTDGFTALTAETARRNHVAAEPRKLSPSVLLTPANTRRTLADELTDDGRISIVRFFYSRCVTLCLAVGGEMQQLQDAIIQQNLQHQIRLISISFDPRDTPDRLQRYAYQMQADATVWQFYTLDDLPQAKQLLTEFGIVVIPAPFGDFEHNAALHVVNGQGELARIVDSEAVPAALHYAKTMRHHAVSVMAAD